MLTLDLHFTITILEIEIHVRKQDFSGALHRLEQLATRLNDNESDIFQRLKVMVLKARIYDRAGTPLKGFSLALRAASMAHKIRLLPLLWEAIGAVGRILTNLEEFGAAVRLLNSIMPQVLECGDCSLAGYMFSCLADGYMGLAGKATSSVLQQKEQLTKALTSIDRSFDEFSRIEDIQGQCEMLAKKATIMHLNGDPVLANDCAAKYLDIKQAAKEQIE